MAAGRIRQRPARHGTRGTGDAPHAVRLVGELIHPAMPPDQVSALGDLVHALVAAGMDDPTVRRVAGRIATVMRPGATH